MRNASGNGIICDYCGDEFHTDFIYYSFDFHKVQVTNWIKRVMPSVELSADLCEDCMESYRERIKAASTTPTPNQFNCDISGEIIQTPNFIYHRCLVSKATVTLSREPFRCPKCGKDCNPDDGPCKTCGPTVLQQKAQIEVDDKYLELNFSDGMYTKFVSHVKKRS